MGEAEPISTGRRRVPVRRVVLASAALLSLWIAWAAINVGRAALEDRAGKRAADRAQDHARAKLTSPAPVTDLKAAQTHFLAAHRRLSGAATLPLRVLPLVGRQIRSVDAMSSAGAQVAGVASGAVVDAQAAIAAGHNSGPERVRLLSRLVDIAVTTDGRLGHVDLGPGHLVGPVAAAHSRFVDELARLRQGLRRGAAGASAAADLLEGPRRYLVLAANNAEMRNGQGMLLSGGVLETSGGNFTLSPFRSTDDLGLPPDAVPLEGDLAARWGWLGPNQEWRNLGVSARFDVTAPLAARMWEATGGGPVDGVLAVDAAALRAVLSATGPVTLEGRTVGAKGIEEEILHGQYLSHADDPNQDARREQLGSIAQVVMQALQDREWDASVLGRSLGEAGRGRHILAWSDRPIEQDGWVAAGIDGSLGVDSALVAVLNRGGNKLDRFLEVRADLGLHGVDSGTEGVLRLRLRNTVPPGEPTYVAGAQRFSGAGEGVYLGIVAVTLPGDASDSRIDGEPSLVVAGADGPTRVIGAAISIPRGAEQTLVVRFRLPVGRRRLRVEPSARLPPIDWTSGGSHWRDDASRTVQW